ncbi:hypothetical protein K493DRAFT_321143 [Basidiobolus meristosporus CBS 931.73]|uniref:C2H2-type domain-containing protein n=1 Tax=Basidiobolus meristosporus CBS 931.73 TaxID=1314790 RepID=A0A1Y1WZC7_9FUNG|nr:hypothetical protein K493DRAFT_321143 [Basidiobolus meristosporus CBS 931.73]|eukprot:ORX78853.1 hypothetical protein K493DRAFT_321143 [Basidiobolus meristosporus CBS 931.73]
MILPPCDEHRANKITNTFPQPSTYMSFVPDVLPPSMMKGNYHPYLGSSRDMYHPRAVSFIANPEMQGQYHPGYYQQYPNSHSYSNLTKVKNHVCQYPGCYMRFKRLEHLKRHFRVHTLERPYACTHKGCEKTFSRRDNLGQHLKTHERRIQRQEQLQQPNP